MFISASRIPDPVVKIVPDPGSGSATLGDNEFKYFEPKELLLSSQKYDPGHLSRIWIFPISDPAVKKAPDPRIRSRSTGRYF